MSARRNARFLKNLKEVYEQAMALNEQGWKLSVIDVNTKSYQLAAFPPNYGHESHSVSVLGSIRPPVYRLEPAKHSLEPVAYSGENGGASKSSGSDA